MQNCSQGNQLNPFIIICLLQQGPLLAQSRLSD
nr:MAG TPA: hypothetical protein [Caudoviricetes sp.]